MFVGGVMAGVGAVLIRFAAVLALLALVIGPVAGTVTHGPSVVVAEGDHAASHVPADGHGQHGGHHHGHGHGHGPHDTTDHDHSASVILSAASVLALPQGKSQGIALAVDVTGSPAEGLRRPPRA